MERTSTITISKKRMALVIVLCMIAGYPIGFYAGSQEQLQSDEDHLILYAESGIPVQIRDHVFNISEIPIENNITPRR